MSSKHPFILNSNIITNKLDINSTSNIKKIIGGNIGNAYISYSIIKTIFGKIVPINNYRTFYDLSIDVRNITKASEFINNNHSSLIICFQDQLREDACSGNVIDHKLYKLIEKIHIPICCVSLGANSFNGYDADLYKKIPKNYLKLFHLISEKSHSIGVRGIYTAYVLEQCGIKNVSIIGCPTWFENGADRTLYKNPAPNFEVLFSSPYHAKLNMVSPSHPCILQDEWEDIDELYHTDHSNNKLTNARFFLSIDRWKEYVTRYDFVYGTRVHGAILAINSGVPAVITNSDARSTEMCQLFDIPHLPGYGTDRLIDAFESYDTDKINKNYKKLYSNYIDFLIGNEVILNQTATETLNQPELAKNIIELNLYSSKRYTFVFYLPYYLESSNGTCLIWKFARDASKIASVKIITFNRGENHDPVIMPGCEDLISSEFNPKDSIVIYPEVITGNPLNASRVTRFLLGSRLLFEGKPFEASSKDCLLSYSNAIADFLPQFNFNNERLEELFNCSASMEKKHILIYYGKCRWFKYKKERLRSILISYGLPIKIVTRTIPENKAKLMDLLQSAALLVSFDSLTNLSFEATLIGVPVLFVDEAFKSSYDNFNHKLHGYYYLSDVSHLNSINCDSKELRDYAQSEYFDVKKKYHLRLNDTLRLMHNHFDNNVDNSSTLKKYYIHENSFFREKWGSSKLFNVTNMRTVLFYHSMNDSTLSFFLAIFGLVIFMASYCVYSFASIIYRSIAMPLLSKIAPTYFLNLTLNIKNIFHTKITSYVYKIRKNGPTNSLIADNIFSENKDKTNLLIKIIFRI